MRSPIIGLFAFPLLLGCAGALQINETVGMASIDLKSRDVQEFTIDLKGSKKYGLTKQGPYCLELVADKISSDDVFGKFESDLRAWSHEDIGKIKIEISLKDTALVLTSAAIWTSPFPDVHGWEIDCFSLPYSIDSRNARFRVTIERIKEKMVMDLVNPKILVKLGKYSHK